MRPGTASVLAHGYGAATGSEAGSPGIDAAPASGCGPAKHRISYTQGRPFEFSGMGIANGHQSHR